MGGVCIVDHSLAEEVGEAGSDALVVGTELVVLDVELCQASVDLGCHAVEVTDPREVFGHQGPDAWIPCSHFHRISDGLRYGLSLCFECPPLVLAHLADSLIGLGYHRWIVTFRRLALVALGCVFGEPRIEFFVC